MKNYSQKWFCELCGKEGTVSVGGQVGLYAVFLEIKDAHAQESPDCSNPVHKIRVINPNYVEAKLEGEGN